jgi:hypothetical protein
MARNKGEVGVLVAAVTVAVACRLSTTLSDAAVTAVRHDPNVLPQATSRSPI